ncbi:unnamed protein product, partial [Gulo gulo]
LVVSCTFETCRCRLASLSSSIVTAEERALRDNISGHSLRAKALRCFRPGCVFHPRFRVSSSCEAAALRLPRCPPRPGIRLTVFNDGQEGPWR